MSTDALREMEKEANSNPATTTIYSYQLYLISNELDERWKNTYRESH